MRKLIDYFFEHKKFYTILFLLLVLNLLFFSFFTLKEYKLYHNTSSEIENVEKKLKNTVNHFKELRKVAKNVKKVKKIIFIIKTKHIGKLEKDFPELTGKIYNILNRYNVQFQHISYSKKDLKTLKLIKVTVHIPLKTTYYNFRRCLNDIEGMPFPVVIERISVNSVEANSISATVDLVVYYKGEKK